VGFTGTLVSVEVDIRRGLPGTDIVGLPGGAVREARDRVRAAVRNSGFIYPVDRVLISLAPAGVKKHGSGFDLAIATAILAASGQIDLTEYEEILALGELELCGRVRPIPGVLPAVIAGRRRAIRNTLVAQANMAEAAAVRGGTLYAVSHLRELAGGFAGIRAETKQRMRASGDSCGTQPYGHSQNEARHWDLERLKGQERAKRALQIAAAGRHNVLLVGPPGSGKTLAGRCFPSLLPPLDRDASLEVSQIHSLAGQIGAGQSLLRTPPFRAPHHSASREGILGGGRHIRPGEVSLAHLGVLFLDEAALFRKSLLQGLREPVQDHRVSIARADGTFWFPADFQLVLATNPCPCGNYGHPTRECLCSEVERHRYWARVGSALLDRIDIRVPMVPLEAETMLGSGGLSTAELRRPVLQAVAMQRQRSRSRGPKWNARMEPGDVEKYCVLDATCQSVFARAVASLSLSTRASYAVLLVARTIADLAGRPQIGEMDVLEAVAHRRLAGAEEEERRFIIGN